jgi:hypothetical protein
MHLRGLNNGSSCGSGGVVSIRSRSWLARRGRRASKSRETGSVTSRATRKALAADRASITKNTVILSIIALLSECRLPDTVSATSWSGTTADNVWKTDSSVTESLGAGTDDVLSDGKGLEAIDADGWVDGESFVDTAAPVRESGIIKRSESWGRGNDVDFVVAVEVSSDFEITEIGESIHSCGVDILVVAGEGEVQTGLRLSSG